MHSVWENGSKNKEYLFDYQELSLLQGGVQSECNYWALPNYAELVA